MEGRGEKQGREREEEGKGQRHGGSKVLGRIDAPARNC